MLLETARPLVPPASPVQRMRLSWLHPAGLVALAAVNYALKLLTLGLYNFWGKTEVRRKIWSAVRIEGEPLQYTGTGRELCTGFLVVFAVVVLPVTLATFAAVLAFGPQSAGLGLFQITLYALFFFLTGIGIWRAQRYRLSRTTWRGIRGGMAGSDVHFAWTYFWTGLLVPLTLGWILPWRATKLQGLLMNASRFGNRPLRFEAQAGALYPRFAVLWLGTLMIAGVSILAIITLLPLGTVEGMAAGNPLDASRLAAILVALYGVLAVAILAYMLLSAVYRARVMNHFAAHTRLETAGFQSTATGWGLAGLALGNFLLWLTGWIIGLVLLLLALGAAQPVLAAEPQNGAGQALIWAGIIMFIASSGLMAPLVQARNARYMIENLSIEGTLPLNEIAQSQDEGLRRGEGLAQALDIDAF